MLVPRACDGPVTARSGVELTIESALSPAGLLGHSTYMLLVVSMLMRRMLWLRLFVIASAIAGILYASLILTDPVGTFWETLLIAVNIGQLCLTWWLDRTTQFDERDAGMRLLHFEHLSPSRFRRLLSAGEWQALPSGTALTAEGTPVPALWFLRSGTAEVRVAGRRVALCESGTFVGEMTVSTGEPANASVRLVEDAEVWRIVAARLRAIAGRHGDVREALEAAFFRTLRLRVIERNRRDAAAARDHADGVDSQVSSSP